MDLNAGYINLIPKLFPNAKVVVDRFHIVQMFSTALNMVRVQVMKTVPKTSKKSKFMQRDWKLFLMHFEDLEATRETYHLSVNYYDTNVNLISACLDLDPAFRTSYETYQTVLRTMKDQNTAAMDRVLTTYKPLGHRMDRSMASLKKYKQQVLHALEFE